MDTAQPARGELRLEVQALRAVAVLLVVFYHLWPGRLPGGYVGVDVFFVISGFLITAHLLREIDSSGRIKLARFWARRARRLLPAAYLVLISSAVAVYVWVPQISWEQNFREIIGSGLYVQNWLLASDSVDYLAADNAPSAAQHYWTLSVEEQFYLVWPLLIMLALGIAALTGRHRRTVVTVVLTVVTAASFTYSLWLTEHSPSAAYFVTPARAWQFGAGALLALWLAARLSTGGARRTTTESSPRARSMLAWAGLAGLAFCGLAFSDSTPFPGTAALVPVVSTIAVILAGSPRSRLSPLPAYRLPPVQKLGDLSYSIYLWHWPPIVILPFVLGHELGLRPRVAILVGTVLAAWLTKRYVEDPIRFGRKFGLRRSDVTFALTGLAAAALVATSLTGLSIAAEASERADAVTKKLNADTPRCFGAASHDPQNPCHNPALDDTLVPAPEAVSEDFADYPDCFAENPDTELKDCTFGDVTDRSLPHVVVIGDSHARAMLPAFVRLAEQKQLTVTAQLKGSCSWSTKPVAKPVVSRTCPTWRANLQTWLKDNTRDIDFVVTTALSSNGKGSRTAQVDGFVEAWRSVSEAGIPIIAIKDNPRRKIDPNTCLVKEDTITPDSCAIPRKGAFRGYDALPEAAAKTPGGHLLDLTPYYCDDSTCPSVIGGVNLYRDGSHLTTTFTRSLAPYVYQELGELELVKPRGS